MLCKWQKCSRYRMHTHPLFWVQIDLHSSVPNETLLDNRALIRLETSSFRIMELHYWGVDNSRPLDVYQHLLDFQRHVIFIRIPSRLSTVFTFGALAIAYAYGRTFCDLRNGIMFRRKPNKVPQDYKIIAFALTEVLYLYSFKILNYVV